MSGAAVRTVYRLNVNKTKFYKLAKDRYPEIGPMKAAQFVKYPRSRDYALDFKLGEYHHHLFLSVVGGKARLGDDCSTYNEEGERVSCWECHALTLDERDMCDMFQRSLDYLMGRSDDATPPTMTEEEQNELAMSQVAEDLREYVLKYCRLDQYGKDAVEAVIRAEYNRCRDQGELGSAGDYAVNIRIIP